MNVGLHQMTLLRKRGKKSGGKKTGGKKSGGKRTGGKKSYTRYYWALSKEAVKPVEFQEHPVKVHVWSAISSNVE